MFRTKLLQPGLMLPTVIAVLGLVILTPLAASAHSNTVYVSPPNGADDTSNIQSALNTCVAYGKGCTVQLASGNYLTKQLVAYNFRGTFKGKGKNKTIVEALPELDVTGFPQRQNNEFFECRPNTTDCSWPSLIVFVDGDIHVSDMAIKISSVPSTKPWFIGDWEVTALIDALRFMGQYRTSAYVERVAISGMPDDNDFGFNVVNGVLFAGEFPRSETPYDYYFLSGTFSVISSSFNTMYDGAGADGFFTDSRLTIGGSGTTGNVFENLAVGIDLESLGNSIIEVSHNTVATGTYASAWVIPWCCWLPTSPSLFLIHDNTFKPSGPYADGIYLQDDPTDKWIYTVIYNNIVETEDIGYGGISAYSTKGTTIVNNTISGNGADAIGIWDGAYAAVIGNNVENFTASSDLAQIVLDGTTAHSTVLCENSNDTVMNQGTDNKLIGCQQVGSNMKAFNTSRQPKGLRGKSALR